MTTSPSTHTPKEVSTMTETTIVVDGETITAPSKREAYYIAYAITGDSRWLLG